MRYLLFSLVLIFMISCSDEQPHELCPDGLPLSYSYTVTPLCYCAYEYVGPHRLEITDGSITSYEHLGDVDTGEIDQSTIDGLALTVLQERVVTILGENPHMQTIEYHPMYKFVSKAYFDIDEQIADEEWGFEITDFEVN